MLTKTEPDQIQSYLADSSHMSGGFAEGVAYPENAAEVAEVLAHASRDRTQVTISGAGTGTVAGRVPFGGIVIATDRMNHIKSVVRQNNGGRADVEAGVILRDLQSAVDLEGLLYPPDPTERSCFIGGTIATNASGARTFKYGPTRNYVERLKVALTTGDVLELRRGELHADEMGRIHIPLSAGRSIDARIPTYRMPAVRKHASGYYARPAMDVIDLFIGSEGTLGVIIEAELKLIPKPEGLLSGVIFFENETDLLSFVREARERSLSHRQKSGRDVRAPSNEVDANRGSSPTVREGVRDRGTSPTVTAGSNLWGISPTVREGSAIDARALEFFDAESLNFLRQKYDTVPATAAGAIFFEQETISANEDSLMSEWLSLIETHHALADQSWFATNEPDQARLREFRHALPVLMNEWFARYEQKKVSTDIAVPDDQFAGMLHLYQGALRGGDLRYTIFGHIGDNHVHVNILPRDDNEAAKAWDIYRTFISRAVKVGGTISAEHGIGKLKREYLLELYGEEHLREMAALKRAFDRAGILGRGNMFAEDLLS